jgi:hypothetical protein
MEQKFMFNTLEIVEDKNQNTFMVKCKTIEMAKRISEKIYNIWELAVEHCADRGTYAETLIHAGDLLTCVPCKETLMLWFDIRMSVDHDKNYDIILDFIKRCTAEGLGTDMLSLEDMLTEINQSV